MLERLHKHASERIRKIAKKHFAGLPVDTVVIKPKKTVYQEIIQYARNGDVGLIVMSTHGRAGVKHLILGNVVERVIRQAPCPVMVIPGKITKK